MKEIYKRFKKLGRGWRYDELGRIILEKEDAPARSKGEPKTMRNLFDEYGPAMAIASDRFGVKVATIAAIIVLESVPIKGTFRRDPASQRYEARLGESSGGLMQTLESTAQETADLYGLGTVTLEDMSDPAVSILLGTAYLARLQKKCRTTDGVLLQAAFNAGGLYRSEHNEWKLRTNAKDRTNRYAAWHNDALAVAAERGLE